MFSTMLIFHNLIGHLLSSPVISRRELGSPEMADGSNPYPTGAKLVFTKRCYQTKGKTTGLVEELKDAGYSCERGFKSTGLEFRKTLEFMEGKVGDHQTAIVITVWSGYVEAEAHTWEVEG